MVVVVLLLGLEFVCLGLLALVRFRAAGSVLIDLQLQRLLVVLGVALTPRLRTAPLLERRAYARREDEAPNQPRVDSLQLSTALEITSCLAAIHDGSATEKSTWMRQWAAEIALPFAPKHSTFSLRLSTWVSRNGFAAR